MQTIKISGACLDTLRHLAESLNVTYSAVIEAGLDALQHRSIPANVLLPFDTLRAVELTASSTRRLAVVLSRLEILVLTARGRQLDAAVRLLGDMSEAPLTSSKPR